MAGVEVAALGVEAKFRPELPVPGTPKEKPPPAAPDTNAPQHVKPPRLVSKITDTNTSYELIHYDVIMKS